MNQLATLSVLLLLVGCGATPGVVGRHDPADRFVRNSVDCPLQTPDTGRHYVVRIAFAEGPEAQARAEAHRLAAESVLKAISGYYDRLTAAEQADALQQLRTHWRASHYNRLTGQACAQAWYPMQDVAGAHRRASDDFDQKLIEVMQRARSTVGSSSLQILNPLASGSGAPHFAADVRHRLAQTLGQAGLQVVAAEARYQLWSSVDAHGDLCRLQLAIMKDGRRAKALPYVNFHPNAFNGNRCSDPGQVALADSRLGLEHGQKVGADGLEVHLDVPFEGGWLCSGAPFTPRVRVTKPARVRLFSVAGDGRVMLIDESKGPVSDTWQSDKLFAVHLGSDQQYQLVAVASVDGPPVGQGLPDRIECLTRSGFSMDRFGPRVAAAKVAFEVRPPHDRACPVDPRASRENDGNVAWIERQPLCFAVQPGG